MAAVQKSRSMFEFSLTKVPLDEISRVHGNEQEDEFGAMPVKWRLPSLKRSKTINLSLERVKEYEEEEYLSQETAIADVSFVAECLRRLPELPFVSGLGKSRDSEWGRKTYLQIVSSLLLQARHLSVTDKRSATYIFPGFCNGCRKSGLCYGCEYRPYCHVHQDWRAMTGGGFAYWKRDVTGAPLPHRHPLNWRQGLPRIVLKDLSDEEKDELKRQLRLAGIIEEGEDDLDTIQNAIDSIASNGPETTTADEGVDVAGDDEEREDLTGRSDERGLGRSDEGGFERSDERGDDDDDGDADAIDEEDEMRASDEEDEFVDVEGDTTRSRDEQPRSHSADYAYDVRVPTGDVLSSREAEPSDVISRGAGLGKTDSLLTSSRGDKTSSRGDKTSSTLAVDSQDSAFSEGMPSTSSSRRRGLYKAPKAFQLKKRSRRATKAASPFSTDRSFDLHKGPGFQTRKSNRSPTKFIDVSRRDAKWEEPKKFELKRGDNKPTEFWSPPRRKDKKKTRNERQSKANARDAVSPDSGLDSERLSESTRENETLSEKPKAPEVDTDLTSQTGDASDALSLDTEPTFPSVSSDSSGRRKRSEIVKKTRAPPTPKVPTFPPPKARTPTPPPPPTRSPSRETVDTYEYVRENTDISEPDIKLPDIELPPLPTIDEKQRDKKNKLMFVVEAPPEVKKEQQKKRKDPPKVRRLPKMQFKRKSRPAEAPMETDDLMTLEDPLDYLAKYCIINPNRLPFYDIIFSTVVSEQTPRFESSSKRSKGDTEVSADHVASPRDTAAFSRHELEMSRDMAILNRATVNGDVVLSPLEQYLKKIIFTLDGLGRQQKDLRGELRALTEQRTHILASRARKLFPEVASPDFVPKKKKGKKKKAKRDKNGPLVAPKGEITDEVIESRLDDAMLGVLRKESDVRQLDASVSRVNDKLTSLAERMQLLEGERAEVTEQCVEFYLLQQQLADRPLEFRRQQSELYLALHPQPDMEMNVDEVERALQQINNRLLTDKEFLYLYHVLNLPKRERINFRTFSILAALSEKVTQLDPLIRSLINKFDFNALDVKMEKSKELFRLLEDESYSTPRGGASAGSLAVELTAGGLTPEHTRYVLSKFNRESRGVVDFLDFVMYVPLFVEIHQRIISDPLKDDLDL